VPVDPDFSVVILFLRNRGLIAQLDTFEVDGVSLGTDAVASPDQCTIAIFLYDSDDDAASSEALLPPFNTFPFLNALDVYIAADPAQTLTATLNGTALRSPRWPSDPEGPIVFVFDSLVPGQ
jgi:hypothetical protein